MSELRAVIDQIDTDLISLLALRQRCIDQAAVLKQIENLPANIPDRVEQVVNNVTTRAKEAGLDPQLAEDLWRAIIQRAIAREELTLSSDQTKKD